MIDNDKLHTNVLNKVQEIIRQVVDDPELVITRSTRADNVKGWDSLTNVQIIVAAEKLFRVRFNSSELSQLENVGSLLDIILARGVI